MINLILEGCKDAHESSSKLTLLSTGEYSGSASSVKGRRILNKLLLVSATVSSGGGGASFPVMSAMSWI